MVGLTRTRARGRDPLISTIVELGQLCGANILAQPAGTNIPPLVWIDSQGWKSVMATRSLAPVPFSISNSSRPVLYYARTCSCRVLEQQRSEPECTECPEQRCPLSILHKRQAPIISTCTSFITHFHLSCCFLGSMAVPLKTPASTLGFPSISPQIRI